LTRVAKVRQDAWSHEDDLLLAETVLRHIREGSTQLKAFEEVGDKLNRTSAACGFRWNAEVRTKYENAIDLAKRQRKERKRALARKHQMKSTVRHTVAENENDTGSEKESFVIEEKTEEKDPTLTLDVIIDYLKTLNKDYDASKQSKNKLDKLEKENISLREQTEELQQQLHDTKKRLATIQEDYQAFIQIMERARRMTVFEDDQTRSAPAFRMDKNGNLEQIVQDL